MNLKEAVGTRISRRAYTGVPIEKSKREIIESLIEKINNTTELKIELLDNGADMVSGMKGYGFFKGVKEVIVIKGDITSKEALEKAGYFGELIILEAEKLNLGTCWVGGTYSKKAETLRCDNGESVFSLITIGNAVKEKTTKEKFIRSMIHRKSKSIEDMSDCDTDMPEWFRTGMEGIVRAPSALNAQKTKVSYKNGEVTIGIEYNRSFDMVDFGICKLHFEVLCGGRFETGNESKWDKEGSAEYLKYV